MHKHRFLLAALLFALSASAAEAQASPSFTISASNTTMAESGASIPFTLTSVNGYAGTVVVTCKPPDVSAGVYIPYCGGGQPGQTVNLKANASLESYMGLWPGAGPPLASRLHVPGRGAETAWAFAGVLLLGFGFRRRRTRWLSILLLSVGMLAGFTGLTGCGGGGNNPNFLTPGTYTYTLTAVDTNNMTASTTAKVTIPSGILR